MKRLTISVPDEVAEKAQRAVRSGDAESVSAYFGHLAEREPDWAAGREAVDRMIEEIGGFLRTPALGPARRWDSIWGRRRMSEKLARRQVKAAA